MADYKSKFTGAEIDDRLNKMLNVTYKELVALRDEGKLIPGQKYRMIDYETIMVGSGVQSANHPFDLVLTALDNKTLDEKCSAIWSQRDTDGYFANSNLPAWDVRYCLDNDINKKLNVSLGGYGSSVLADNLGGMLVLFSSKSKENKEYNGTTYIAYRAEIEEGGVVGVVYALLNTEIAIGETALILAEAMGNTQELGEFVLDTYSNESKGVILYLSDENGNSCYYDFKNVLMKRTVDLNNEEIPYLYTFSLEQNGVVSDYSLSPLCRNNSIGSMEARLNFIMFRNTEAMAECSSNKVGDYHKNGIFGNNCNGNTILSNRRSIMYADDYNKFDINNAINCFFPEGCMNTFIEPKVLSCEIGSSTGIQGPEQGEVRNCKIYSRGISFLSTKTNWHILASDCVFLNVVSITTPPIENSIIENARDLKLTTSGDGIKYINVFGGDYDNAEVSIPSSANTTTTTFVAKKNGAAVVFDVNDILNS